MTGTFTYRGACRSPVAYLPAAAYVVLALFNIPHYFLWDANAMAGMALLPFCTKIETGRFSLRYLTPALPLCACAFFVPVNTLIFLSLIPAALLLVENTFGKVGTPTPVLLLVCSPVFRFFSAALGFPLRLKLSEAAAALLRFTGIGATASGNQIRLAGGDFHVDDACAGLNMLTVSLLVVLFLAGYYRGRFRKKDSPVIVLLLLFITLALNLIGNVFRIVLLVRFRILPDNPLHDVAGIICLCAYVMAPLLVIVKAMVKRQRDADPAVMSDRPSVRYGWIHALLFVVLVTASCRLTRMDQRLVSSADVSISGFRKTALDGGILKFENANALIYLKPTPFYMPEHDPKICWRGSGYVFSSIVKTQIAGTRMYRAELVKGSDRIYAAWWFASGTFRSIDQVAWRWRGMKGERFYLVNVNAASPAALNAAVTGLVTNKRQILRF